MASAYQSWLQKHEFKVLKSPPTSKSKSDVKSAPAPSEPASFLTSLVKTGEHVSAEKTRRKITLKPNQETAKPAVLTAQKRPRSPEDVKKAKKRPVTGQSTATTADRDVYKTLTMSTKVLDKRKTEEAQDTQEINPTKRRRMETEILKRRSGHQVEKKALKRDEASDQKQMEKRLAAILGESQYWQAVDRFSHLD